MRIFLSQRTSTVNPPMPRATRRKMNAQPLRFRTIREPHPFLVANYVISKRLTQWLTPVLPELKNAHQKLKTFHFPKSRAWDKLHVDMSDDHEEPKMRVALSDGPVHNPDLVLIRKEQESRRYLRQILSHTLSRKNLMALTGLFLCFFLVIHLFGNLQLLLPVEAARWQFNFYSKLLSGNIFIQLISYILFGSILAHAIYALVITIRNRRSNGKRYEYDLRGVSSKWYARKMGLLGTIILFFLVIHLRDFWYQLQFGQLPLDKDGQKDLYTLVVTVYHDGWYVLIYVLCMVALGYHLLHGFFSAARTLGFYDARYVHWVRVFGWVYSIGISAGFALIPVYIHFARL